MWFLLACHTPDDSSGPDASATPTDSQDSGFPIDPYRPTPMVGPAPVVIIGAGPAGLAAALDLPNAILLEADSEVGGRFRWAGGLMLMVGTEEQQQLSVVDSPENAASEWPQITGSEATTDTLAYLQASDAVHDRLVELGVSYNLSPPDDWIGTPRIHQPIGNGVAVVNTLAAALPETVDLRLNTAATGIVLDGNRVVGVQLSDQVIPANTVIIASGGFVNRMDIVETLHDYEAGTWSVGSEGGATGFAYDQAISLGLPLSDLPSIGWFARTIGVPGPDAKPIPFNVMGILPWVTVDQNGTRFLDENRTGSVSTSGILGTHTDVWNLTTLELLQLGVPPDSFSSLQSADPSQFVCSTDWDALSETIGLPPLSDLFLEISDYRTNVAIDPLGRKGTSFPDFLGTPCAFRPGHEAAKNFGGLVVDAEGRVPGVKGLWAVGEAAGMAAPGLGGAWGFDGSSGAVIWSGWRTAAAVWGKSWP